MAYGSTDAIFAKDDEINELESSNDELLALVQDAISSLSKTTVVNLEWIDWRSEWIARALKCVAVTDSRRR
jgi:hypothetical protein